MHENVQKYDRPPASGHVLNVIPIATPVQIKWPPTKLLTHPLRNNYLSALVNYPTLSCSPQSSTSKQKRSFLFWLNTNLESPGPCAWPVDPASMAHALWISKRNKARSLSASDAVNTIYFYDMEVISIDNWRAVTTKPTNNSDQESHQQKTIPCLFCTHDHRKSGTPYL